jgi:aconitase B
MSDPELGPAVMGAVAALVGAYKNAGSIVENLKEQRKSRGALAPPDELEEALQEGHWEIEKIQAQGIQRFGSAFEQGDGEC